MRIRTKKYWKTLTNDVLNDKQFSVYDWIKKNKINKKRKYEVLKDYLLLCALLDSALPQVMKDSINVFGGKK